MSQTDQDGTGFARRAVVQKRGLARLFECGINGGERSRGAGDDAEKEVGSVVYAGDQMEGRQGEDVGSKIQAVACGWGWKK